MTIYSDAMPSVLHAFALAKKSLCIYWQGRPWAGSLYDKKFQWWFISSFLEYYGIFIDIFGTPKVEIILIQSPLFYMIRILFYHCGNVNLEGI